MLQFLIHFYFDNKFLLLNIILISATIINNNDDILHQYNHLLIVNDKYEMSQSHKTLEVKVLKVKKLTG